MFKKGDKIVIISVLVLLVLALLFKYWPVDKGTDNIAVIKQNDKILMRINLEKIQGTQHINIQGRYPQVVRVENGRICFEQAECPDKLCVKTGWLNKKGDVTVCLPNQSLIYIEGSQNEIDGISY